MGKLLSVLTAAALLLGAVAVPWRPGQSSVQAAPAAVSCAAMPSTAPMQGHYTGTWHSDGDYHFSVFDIDLDLKITIDGTINAGVSPDGQILGTAQGKVDAPITHNGTRDVSSGYGTIKGTLSGTMGAAGATLVLHQPVVDMQWGTFVGGGYTVERFITMPDYTFTIASSGCVTAAGSIAETNFPVMNVVADGEGQLTQAPGLGTATGSWTLTSDEAEAFSQLLGEVDGFITHADSILAAGTITPQTVQSQILAPLQDLRSRIAAQPDVARCLLDRLGAWEAWVLPPLFGRASVPSTGVSLQQLRAAADVFRSASMLNLDCAVPDGGARDALVGAGDGMLDRAIAARSWGDAALIARELLLLGGDGIRPSLTSRIEADLHTLAGSAGAPDLWDVARAAYAFGDDADASAAAGHLQAHVVEASHPAPLKSPKGKKHKPKGKGKTKAKPVKAKPTPTATATTTPTPTATPKPTATATATSRPKTLAEILAAGIVSVRTVLPSGTPILLAWAPVDGAARYVVTVADPGGSGPLWTWSGAGTSVPFGDTAIDGLPGSANDGPAAPLPTSYEWSVLALDGSGRVVGAALRVHS